MKTMPVQRKKQLRFIHSSNHPILSMVINIYLVIGVTSLLITLFWLMGHLNVADSVIKYCVPGFVLGISSVIIYFTGYYSMISEQNHPADDGRPPQTKHHE